MTSLDTKQAMPLSPPLPIANNIRRASDLSARYGGEGFAVLLPETSITGAFDLAENIRHSVHALRADQQGRADSTPTISIGVASMTPRPGLYPKDLIKAAALLFMRLSTELCKNDLYFIVPATMRRNRR